MQIYFFDRQKRPSETRALCQRFKSPSGANLSGQVWKKTSLHGWSRGVWQTFFTKYDREGEKAFLAAKSFYLINSPPWLEPSWVWLKWDRHLLGSAAAERLLSDFVFVLMHSAAKILTSTTQQGRSGQHEGFTESRHSHKHTEFCSSFKFRSAWIKEGRNGFFQRASLKLCGVQLCFQDRRHKYKVSLHHNGWSACKS